MFLEVKEQYIIVRQNYLNRATFRYRLAEAFRRGLGSVAGIDGRVDFVRLAPRRDVLSLASDWRRVGNQIRLSADRLKR